MLARSPFRVSEGFERCPVKTAPHKTLLEYVGSAHVDVGDLDRVVPVAEPVPGWNLGLHVAGRVGRAGAERVSADLGRLPPEGPVLPLVRAHRGLEVHCVPLSLAREADMDGS